MIKQQVIVIRFSALSRLFDRFDTDCGGGIGRVTKNLLLPRFNHVDIVEQSPRLLNAAPGYIGELGSRRVSLILTGLQVINTLKKRKL